MSVQMQQFRVVGVSTETGEDVSVVIDAATKAAAEVKAEQMCIETTHIVRLKQETPEPPDEHELFSSEAAEALAGKPTASLIEEVVPPEEPKQAPPAETASAVGPQHPQPPSHPKDKDVVAVIARPTYAAPNTRREPTGADVSGVRAFGLVLLVLLGISAGAYYVLIHEPNTLKADEEELIFGQDLFSDVIDPVSIEPADRKMRDAFNNRTTNTAPEPGGPPIAEDQQVVINDQAEGASAPGLTPKRPGKLTLQSVATTKDGRFAVINNKLYKQGSMIGSATLVSVANDWVLIERDGKQFTLKIEASSSE